MAFMRKSCLRNVRKSGDGGFDGCEIVAGERLWNAGSRGQAEVALRTLSVRAQPFGRRQPLLVQAVAIAASTQTLPFRAERGRD